VQGWLISLAIGLLVGALTTVTLALLKVRVGLPDIAGVWIIALVLSLWNVRLTCIAYAAGVLTLLQEAALLAEHQGIRSTLISDVLAVHTSALLMLAAVLHIAEGVLIYLMGASNANPLFVQSRRGQIVGAYLLQKFWLVPAVITTMQGVVLPFPVLLGFSGLATASVPKRMARYAGFLTLLYGIAILLMCLLAIHMGRFYTIVALFMIGLHELLNYHVHATEAKAPPFFVRPSRGVKVLAVIPGSPAHKLQLSAGETIIRVAGMMVNSPYDIHFAIDQNPAYVKLEVADLRGEIRFIGTPVYEKDPHQLGVIIVPDERAREYAHIYKLSVGAWIGRWHRSKRRFLVDPNTNSS